MPSAAPAPLVADLVQDERELLHRGDDYLLAALDQPAQIARAVGEPTVADIWVYCRIVSRICRSRMRRSVTTMIEPNTGGSSLVSPNKLMGQPGDGTALVAAGRAVDEVAPAHARGRRLPGGALRRAGESERPAPGASLPAGVLVPSPPPGGSSPGCSPNGQWDI